MVRNYTRKSARDKVPHDIIRKGINEVVSCGRSIRSVAKEIGLPTMTFCRYIKRAKESGDVQSVPIGYHGNKPTVFSSDQEAVLVKYLTTAANMYFGLSPKDVRVLAYECADNFNVKMPDSWTENKSAGYDWFASFMKRNSSLSIRTPEATSLSRATSFNRQNVRMFFQKLSKVLTKHNIQSYDIWNLDETGLSTVQKPRSIVAPRGVKQVGSLTSQERGSLVTLCFAVSATGNSVPPLMIFPRVKYFDHFVRDGPTGCIGASHPSGWMTAENFLLFMKHFAKHVKPTNDKKVLLLLDNHISHISVDTLNFAKENGIIILSFPPHCSHKLQPLDRTVYGPFKRYLAAAQDKWMRLNPGKTLSIYDLPALAKECLPKAATPENIINGFKVAGIQPYNEDIFREADFAPSDVTDRPYSEESRNENIAVEEWSEQRPVARSNNVTTAESNSCVGIQPEQFLKASPTPNAWQEIDNHVKGIGRKVVTVRGDGHCLLYAIRESLSAEQILDITHEDMCIILKEEVQEHLNYYNDFTNDNADVVSDIDRYIHEKEYTNDSVDLVLMALCNALSVSAIIYRYHQNAINISAHAPGRQGTQSKGDIYLALYGNDTADSHYNWLQCCGIEHDTRVRTVKEPSVTHPDFSPHTVRPHPVAPPRKMAIKRRKRKCAILTDTPEKRSIELEQLRKVCKPLKNTVKPRGSKQPSKANRNKTKSKQSKESTDEEECYCFVCIEPYSNSKSREKWLQCCQCKGWAHLECTDVIGTRVYVCHNCDSDDDLNI